MRCQGAACAAECAIRCHGSPGTDQDDGQEEALSEPDVELSKDESSLDGMDEEHDATGLVSVTRHVGGLWLPTVLDCQQAAR